MPGHTADGDGRAQNLVVNDAELCRRIQHLRHHRRRDIEELEQIVIPTLVDDVEQVGAGRIADVSDMTLSTGQLVDQPAIDGAECQFAAAGARAGAVHCVQYPGDLGGGEVGVEQQAGAGVEPIVGAILA